MTLEERQTMSDGEYLAHLRTYERFKHLAFWFSLHVALILAGLYFVTLTAWWFFGALIILAGVGALAYGVLTTERAGRKAERGEVTRPADIQPESVWPAKDGTLGER